jgi:hypothetical protein
MRVWLAVLPLVAGGVLVSHALAYRLTGTQLGSLHAYLSHAPQVLAVAGLVGCALGIASRRGPSSAWPYPVAAVLAFAVQEHVERLAHTGDLPWLLASPVFLVGLLLQLPVALLVWSLASRLLAPAELRRATPPSLSALLLAVLAPRAAVVAPAPAPARTSRGPPHLHRP